MKLFPKRKGIQVDQNISGDQIMPATIVTQLLKNGSIATAKIAELAVTSAKINDLVVDKLTAGTMTADVTISNTFKTASSPNPRIEITSSQIVGYSDATTKQFYVQASDGKGYFGGGSSYLDSSGIHIDGQFLHFKASGQNDCFIYNLLGNLRLATNVANHISFNSKVDSILPYDSSRYCGSSTSVWNFGYFLNLYRTNEYSLQHYDDVALIRQMKPDSKHPGFVDFKTIPSILKFKAKPSKDEPEPVERIDVYKEISLALGAIRQIAGCLEALEGRIARLEVMK